MQRSPQATRFDGAPTVDVGGVQVPVALGFRFRLLGLAGLDLEAAGAGLLIPRCAGVHTFGMRFALDLVFLDAGLRPLAVRRSVRARRVAGHRGAAAVLELPAGGRSPGQAVAPDSGEFSPGGGEPGFLPPE
jgi:uncharacterized protein